MIALRFLKDVPGVAYVINLKEAQTANVPEELRTRIVNGYSVEHSGVVQVILKPGWYASRSATGTTPRHLEPI